MTFSVKNIQISVSVYFAAVITFALLFAPNGSALPALLCCILHEIGHLTAIYLSGGRVRKMSLGAYGMRIEPVRTLKISPGKEIIISLAGPFVNVILLIAGIVLKDTMITGINLALCVFNLLPVGKTDGGSALFNGLSLFLEERKIKDALRITSTSFLIIIYVFGVIILVKTKYNFTLLAVAVYMTVINTVGIQ